MGKQVSFSTELEYRQQCSVTSRSGGAMSISQEYKASGENQQAVKKGDVVIVHNDIARATSKMAVIDDLIVGGRAATIHTLNVDPSPSYTYRIQ